MKKIILIATVGVFAGCSFSSCHKNYTCVCNGVDTSGVPIHYNATFNSEGQAQSRCSAQRATYDTAAYKHITCAVPI